ncbi:uncharacterized protein LOC131025588 [Salvia miltiorrhiza]|uniref:uncharacterized protein LOC131025588 n=1 Tax=Salvia miltiorrhiza TaxID=226208 RepID=UPI0025ACEE20|nr:uncharacterized protein LOC131025588 [Salvia miltiorrhiza]
MEFVRYIYVRYNGVVDGIHYVGGATEVLPLLNETVASLIYSINNVLTTHSLSPNYQLYYLATNRFGRETKCVISDDDDVQGLLETAEYPMVYVEHNNDPVEEAYIPTFDFGQASGYGDDEAQSSQYETSYHARESAPPTQYFSWDGQPLDESAWNLNEMCGRFNQVRTDDDSDEEAVQPEDEAEEPDDDSDEEDEEYDPTNESGTDSAASEDLLDDDLIEFTATERAGWIRQSRTRHGNPTDSTGDLSNWIVPLIPVDATTSLVARESELSRVADLGKNSFYNSKEELVLAVGFWNMKQGAEAKVVRSDQGRLYYKCKHSDKCKFDVRASCHGGGMWGVHKFKEHSCEGELGILKRIKAHSNVVAAYVEKRIRDDGEVIKPKSIMSELLREFGVRIKYDVALRARNLNLEKIYGRIDDSFLLLPKYLYALTQANPGTVMDFEVDENNRFKHLFLALAASITPFFFSLRPVIVVDGTHLKGKNNGILFVAVTKDANEQVFPLAFGVGPIENDESWKWFLSNVRQTFGQPDNLLVVSDAHVSIANAVKSELPNATHGLCYYHLQNKIKGYGQAVVELFRQAAYAYTDSEFSRAMSAMAQLKPAAYGKLMRVGPEKWARSQSPVTRYSFLTSNAAEALNARLLWARRLPICSMLEAIRMVLEQWFNDRLASAEESDDLLTPEAKQKISAEISKSRRYTAKRTSERKYRVRAGDRRFMVDLQAKSCECNEFDLDGMPCSHAIAAITEAKEPVEDYVEAYYLRSSLVQTYSGAVNHLPPLEHWEIPFEVASDIILPNLSRRQAGRPRESRIPSAGERPTQRTTTADASSSLGKRAPKTCGLCGSPGHTRRACKGTGWEQ